MTPFRASSFAPFSWLRHGFGSRHDGAWTPTERTARLHQVHAAGVVAVTTPGHHGDGDALITTSRELWLEIRTADCVPVLLVDPRQRVVAAVHAGWRGTAAGIAGETVRVLVEQFGSRPDELIAAIGPCISACCFAVGDDVAEHFPQHTAVREPRARVDLKAANRDQLVAAGLGPGGIETLAQCTCCDANDFHSFRRDRSEGRMVAAVAIAKD